MRVLTVLRNHVPVAETPRPRAAARTMRGRPSSTPFPSSMSQRAIRASGSAASCDKPNAASINRGSCRYPSLHSRHIDDSAGGRSPAGEGLVEDVIRHALVFLGGESFGLEIEHRAVAAAQRHELVVRTELDHASMLEHADAVGMAHGRK